LAGLVYDQNFREERVTLVRDYRMWFEQPACDLDTLRKMLAAMPDPDNRRIYKNLARARWVAAPQPQIENLKALVVIALVDSTLLDAVLGRLIGLRIRQHHRGEHKLSDADLAAAIKLCGSYFTTGRPWELGKWR